jgi:hypothetical protein
MYKTLFAEAYPFTYSLSDLGNYYVAWRRLMDHWKAQFPEQVLSINYESLVQNTEPTVRGLLEFCELTWEPQCLDFHKRAGGVSTASASQVRQPIYQSSVGKWRRYEHRLEPLLEIFQSAKIEIE